MKIDELDIQMSIANIRILDRRENKNQLTNRYYNNDIII